MTFRCAADKYFFVGLLTEELGKSIPFDISIFILIWCLTDSRFLSVGITYVGIIWRDLGFLEHRKVVSLQLKEMLGDLHGSVLHSFRISREL